VIDSGETPGQRDMHVEAIGGLDHVDRRLPRLDRFRAGDAEELAVQAIGLLEERECLAPHPAGKIARSHGR
jgi:hypothetical protein